MTISRPPGLRRIKTGFGQGSELRGAGLGLRIKGIGPKKKCFAKKGLLKTKARFGILERIVAVHGLPLAKIMHLLRVGFKV